MSTSYEVTSRFTKSYCGSSEIKLNLRRSA